ncbi:MAG: DoxX family protein [Vicinamibacterales bacterium]
MLKKLLGPAATTPLVSLALLVLRLWFGAMMVTFHGWVKVTNFESLSARFSDPYNLSRPVSLSLSILAEFVCASLIVLGAATRPAAAVLAVNMTTAFVFSHGMRLSGPGNGELAFLYLGAFLTLLVAGAGRYSLDRVLFGRGH